MKRYSVVPHGTGAAHMPSVFTDSRMEAEREYLRMIRDGANCVMVWDDFDSMFIRDYREAM